MRTYEVYLVGSTRPVYVYRSSRWFYKRLKALAGLHSLRSVHVKVQTMGATQWYRIALNPAPNLSWSSERLSV